MAHHKSSDPNIFILPDLGEGVHEAELISWKVKPGEKVEEHQTVAEMNTDKALVEVPSPRAGVIKELNGNPGDILKVGQVAWTYEGASNEPRPSGSGPAGSRNPATGPQHLSPAAAVPFENTNGGAHSDPVPTEREDAGTVVGTMSGSLGAVSGAEGKALATPAVRRLARDLNVDIDSLRGTGLAGRVTEKDVRAASSSTPSSGTGVPPVSTASTQRLATTVSRPPARQDILDSRPTHDIAPAPRTTLVPTGDTQRIPVRGVRRNISLRLRQSVDRHVHFTVMDEADVTILDEVRHRMGAASGEKLSYLPFIVSAVCRALKQFPALNATVDDEAEEILRYSHVHMGIAADTEQGLTVPVIPNTDSMGVLEIGRHIAELARMTRDRSIPRDRLMGSTFTISNVGSYAGRFATPIINYPEVGILAAGRVREGVVAKHGGIHVAKLLPLSLTCDHRSVDGADAARCLALIMELLGKPEGLLTPARG